MIWARRLLLVALIAVAAGCATASSPPPRQSAAPRTRCLSDPNESGGLRPLFFFLCVESP